MTTSPQLFNGSEVSDSNAIGHVLVVLFDTNAKAVQNIYNGVRGMRWNEDEKGSDKFAVRG